MKRIITAFYLLGVGPAALFYAIYTRVPLASFPVVAMMLWLMRNTLFPPQPKPAAAFDTIQILHPDILGKLIEEDTQEGTYPLTPTPVIRTEEGCLADAHDKP